MWWNWTQDWVVHISQKVVFLVNKLVLKVFSFDISPSLVLGAFQSYLLPFVNSFDGHLLFIFSQFVYLFELHADYLLNIRFIIVFREWLFLFQSSWEGEILSCEGFLHVMCSIHSQPSATVFMCLSSKIKSLVGITCTWKNWTTVRMIVPTWFDHLKENLSDIDV